MPTTIAVGFGRRWLETSCLVNVADSHQELSNIHRTVQSTLQIITNKPKVCSQIFHLSAQILDGIYISFFPLVLTQGYFRSGGTGEVGARFFILIGV